MPHRTMGLWIGILGLLAVVFLILIGRNLEQAAGRGPRWKRRLLAAGLALLAVFGYQPTAKAGKAPHRAKRVRKSLATNPDWQKIVDIYHRAETVAAQPAYSYPFDSAGKRKLLADLAAAPTMVKQLEAAGLLTRWEARLLTTELKALTSKVRRYRPKPPTGVRGATCYKPAPPPPKYRPSFHVMKKQVPILRKISQQRTLNREVLDLVKKRIERDVTNLETAKPGWPRPKSPSEITRAKRLGRRVKALWKRIWRRVPPPPPRPHRPIRTCYMPAMPPRLIPTGGKKPRSSLEKVQTDKRLAALERLDRRGILSRDVAALIRSDLGPEPLSSKPRDNSDEGEP